MKNFTTVLGRILYKHYIVAVSWFIWIGVYLTTYNEFRWTQDIFWGVFMIVSGVLVIYSELDFISKCNNPKEKP